MSSRLWRWQVLEEAQERLQKVVRERLEEARGRRDHATILRFTRLFPLLGMPVRPCCISTNVAHALEQHDMTLYDFASFSAEADKPQTVNQVWLYLDGALGGLLQDL